MTILVFSDLHGALPVARRMVSLVERIRPAAVIFLGDMLYHGPRNPQANGYAPKETAAALAEIAPRCIAVRGNCDSEVDAAILPFPLAPGFAWILTEQMRICAVHGHTLGPDAIPPLLSGDVLLSGHTHVPTAQSNAAGIRLCNPGSLTLPKEGSPPCYGLFSDGVFRVFTAADELYLELDCRS